MAVRSEGGAINNILYLEAILEAILLINNA